MAEWVFVRHGESVANAGGWLAGARDADLTAAGVEQARALLHALAPLEPAAVWSSDLVRARRTAELALDGRGLPVRCAPELRERSMGAWEGRLRDELRRTGELDRLLTWAWRPPGGESQADVAARVLPWLDAVDGPGLRLAFAHGGLLRVVVGLARGEPIEAIGRIRIDNCAVLRLRTPVGGWARLLPAEASRSA